MNVVERYSALPIYRPSQNALRVLKERKILAEQEIPPRPD